MCPFMETASTHERPIGTKCPDVSYQLRMMGLVSMTAILLVGCSGVTSPVGGGGDPGYRPGRIR